MKVIIVGGGPAGILAAISSANCGNDVLILEKMNSLGRKLLITGKGRCNITSSLEIKDFIENIPGNGRFLYSAFENFTNNDIVNMLEKEGVKVKEERGNRIFPVSDRSVDVLDAFIRILKKLKVKIQTNSKVQEIIVNDNIICGVKLENGKVINANKVIIATGGKSYPLTGSTGDGYKMAQKCGIEVTNIRGSIIPIEAEKVCSRMQGVSLRNVGILIEDKSKNKKIYEDFGELMFTHFGVSGPTILSSSAHLIRYKNIDELMSDGKIVLKIDLKPALTEEQLNNRVLRDFEEFKNKKFQNSLDKLLPQKLIPVIIEKSKINPDKKVNEITKEERKKLIEVLKCFEIKLTKFRPIEEGIVTAGGIKISEINPKTMESKKIKGLYFAGEVIDVDAYTGGFNLQIAYSTGYTAGMN